MDLTSGSKRSPSGKLPFLSVWVDAYWFISLNSILNKKTLAPEKLEELKKKVNILAAFFEKKGEQVTEETKAKVEQAKAKIADEL